MARAVILDTDPGQDDAVALFLALASPEIMLKGVCAVAGNVPLRLTEANARRLLTVVNRTDVPVFAGCERPLVKALETAEEVHGASGLDGYEFPEAACSIQAQHAVDFITQTCLAAADGEITIVAIGPLTNVAVAIARHRAIVPKIREIVVMGGARFTAGNTSPGAEFNIATDPTAARIVFESGAPIVAFPLDVTHQVLTTPERLARLESIGNSVTDCIAGMLKYYNRYDERAFNMPGGPLHDPCTIAWLIDPSLFEARRCHVRVIDDGGPLDGFTHVDWWHKDQRPPNCDWMHTANAAGFYDLLCDRLARFSR